MREDVGKQIGLSARKVQVRHTTFSSRRVLNVTPIVDLDRYGFK